ncbi:MAG: SDR family oxidoreductase [Candidatus Dadabacteria bacterium]|nr:SDR family oxidoreductase [Candidatus Dadabacteria bacterium]
MERLTDRIAILTGGTGALGSKVLKALLDEGAKAVCVYFREDQLRDNISLLKDKDYKKRLMFLKADLTRDKQVEKIVTKTIDGFGGVDILINVAGGFTYGKLLDTEVKTLDHMMNTNLKSAFIATKAVLPHMIKQNYGRIVNVSSRPALKGTKGLGAYAASKAAVLNLTETTADEVMNYDINVNAILPSTIDTPANRLDMPKADFAKWVKPEDIARVIIFLISEDSRPITGAGIPVYGRA